MFERQEIKDSNEACQYRLAQEGLPFILPFLSHQRVQLSKEDFLTLLRERHLMMPGAMVLEQQAEGGCGGRGVLMMPGEMVLEQQAEGGCGRRV